jgi:hypothetical protein
MPQLGQSEPDIKKFMLPSTASLPEDDQAWVVMDVGTILSGDFMDVLPDDDNAPAGQISGDMLCDRIQEWNFTEADGSAAALTLANIRRLAVDDMIYLMNQLMPSSQQNGQLSATEKKS